MDSNKLWVTNWACGIQSIIVGHVWNTRHAVLLLTLTLKIQKNSVFIMSVQFGALLKTFSILDPTRTDRVPYIGTTFIPNLENFFSMCVFFFINPISCSRLQLGDKFKAKSSLNKIKPMHILFLCLNYDMNLYFAKTDFHKAQHRTTKQSQSQENMVLVVNVSVVDSPHHGPGHVSTHTARLIKANASLTTSKCGPSDLILIHPCTHWMNWYLLTTCGLVIEDRCRWRIQTDSDLAFDWQD